jgi:hypothetical protein
LMMMNSLGSRESKSILAGKVLKVIAGKVNNQTRQVGEKLRKLAKRKFSLNRGERKGPQRKFLSHSYG